MIRLLFISFIIYSVFASIAYIQAKRRHGLFFLDYSTPAILIIAWLAITWAGYGERNLNNVLELPVTLSLSLIILYLRVFLFDNQTNAKRHAYLALTICLISMLILRTFFFV